MDAGNCSESIKPLRDWRLNLCRVCGCAIQDIDEAEGILETPELKDKIQRYLHLKEFLDGHDPDTYESGASFSASCGLKGSSTKSSKVERTLNKLINISEKEGNEFAAFGASAALQLQKLPEHEAYLLMSDIQGLITQRKIKCIEKSKQSMALKPINTPVSTFGSLPSISNQSRILKAAHLNSPVDLTRVPLKHIDRQLSPIDFTELAPPTTSNSMERNRDDILSSPIFDANTDFPEEEI